MDQLPGAEVDADHGIVDQEPGPRRDRPRRGRGLRVGIVVVGLSAVGAVALLSTRGIGGPDEPAPTGAVVLGTTPLTRGTLSDTVTLEGRLDYGLAHRVPLRADGVITWLPRVGAVLKRGDTLLRVDDRPVVLLRGSIPMYRDLSAGTPATPATPVTPVTPSATGSASTGSAAPISPRDGTASQPSPAGASASTSPAGATGSTGTGPAADSGTAAVPGSIGRDVKQLEQNLRALGYGGFTVDTVYSSKTAAAVRRWQHDLGLPRTGVVAAGSVVFEPDDVRVAATGARPGDAVSQEALSVTGTGRMVSVQASAADLAWAVPEAKVSVTFPSGALAEGRVDEVGSAATQAASGQGEGGSGEAAGATVPVTIRVGDQSGLGQLDSSTVEVSYVINRIRDTYSVPVLALVALAEGGYGLEVQDPQGSRFVAVSVDGFADGRVAVSGAGLRDGMTIRLPA